MERWPSQWRAWRRREPGRWGGAAIPRARQDAGIDRRPRVRKRKPPTHSRNNQHGCTFGPLTASPPGSQYKEIQCGFAAETHTLTIDRVQGDPYAAPSRARISVPNALARFPAALYASRARERALCDFLARAFSRKVTGNRLDQKAGGGSWHGAKGGDVEVDTPGQHILYVSSPSHPTALPLTEDEPNAHAMYCG